MLNNIHNNGLSFCKPASISRHLRTCVAAVAQYHKLSKWTKKYIFYTNKLDTTYEMSSHIPWIGAGYIHIHTSWHCWLIWNFNVGILFFPDSLQTLYWPRHSGSMSEIVYSRSQTEANITKRGGTYPNLINRNCCFCCTTAGGKPFPLQTVCCYGLRLMNTPLGITWSDQWVSHQPSHNIKFRRNSLLLVVTNIQYQSKVWTHSRVFLYLYYLCTYSLSLYTCVYKVVVLELLARLLVGYYCIVGTRSTSISLHSH